MSGKSNHRGPRQPHPLNRKADRTICNPQSYCNPDAILNNPPHSENQTAGEYRTSIVTYSVVRRSRNKSTDHITHPASQSTNKSVTLVQSRPDQKQDRNPESSSNPGAIPSQSKNKTVGEYRTRQGHRDGFTLNQSAHHRTSSSSSRAQTTQRWYTTRSRVSTGETRSTVVPGKGDHPIRCPTITTMFPQSCHKKPSNGI